MAYTIVGEKIALYLKRKSMKQKELSIKTGIQEAVLSRYVRGVNKPGTTNLKKIAEALGVTVSDLTGDVNDAINLTAFQETQSVVTRNSPLLTLEQKLEIINGLFYNVR